MPSKPGRYFPGWVLILLCGYLLLPDHVFGADESVMFHLKSGERLTGIVVRENATHVTVRTSVAGRVRIPVGDIVKRETPAEAAAALKAQAQLAEAYNEAQERAKAAEKDVLDLRKQLETAKADDKPAPTSPDPKEADAATSPENADVSPAEKPAQEVAASTEASAPAKPAATPTPPPAATAAPPAVTPPVAAVTPGTNDVPKAKWYLVSSYAPSFFKPFLTNWTGSFGVGTDLGFGTRERRSFNANLNARHVYNRFRNDIVYNATYGTVAGVQAANRMEGSMKTDIDLYQKRRLYAWNQYFLGYDDARLINLRIEEAVGMGYKVLQRDRFVLNAELGVQYQHFDYHSANDRDILSGRISQNSTWKPNSKLTVNQTLTLLQNIRDYDEFRVRLTVNATYPLYKKISFKVDIINEYETNPRQGIDGNDLQVQTSLGLKFP